MSSASACEVTIRDGYAEAKYPLAYLLDLVDRRVISRKTFEEMIGIQEVPNVQEDTTEDIWDVI